LCRNCLLKHITEGKVEGGVEMMVRAGRRCKQLLDEEILENEREAMDLS
jgi:hypothetical protein